ncbi:MAG: hypothetical protein ACKPKO_63875, partial [Candidatus Fonsibacter sp.]
WADKCKFEPTGNGAFVGTLTTVGDITPTTGNITASIGNIAAYGNIESYNGNITSPWGSIVGQSVTSTGNITAQCNISGGTITSSGYLAITATTGRPTTPSAMGCYLGRDSNYSAALELCGVNAAYVDFTTAGTDMKGRFMYSYSITQFDWFIASSFTSNMALKYAGLYLGATLVSASDKRLKFNEKPLVNALNIINKLEPVEYDQTYDLVE